MSFVIFSLKSIIYLLAPELPFAVNPNSPFKRRSSYEYSTNLENINLNQRSNQCRIHGNRVINYPSVHSNEDLVFISETHNTPLSHSNSSANLGQTQQNTQNSGPIRRIHFCPEFLKAMESVRYIADCTRRTEEENEVNLEYYLYSKFENLQNSHWFCKT